MGPSVAATGKSTPADGTTVVGSSMGSGSTGVFRWTAAGGMVARLVIEPQLGAWVFYRLDEQGGFVGDSWHETREDAVHQARREFDVTIE